jgi:hypothetical protein
VAISRFQGGSPRLCRLRTAPFWPRWQALICTDHMSDFMGPDKPSSFCNYFVESYFPASRWFVGGTMRQPIMTVRPDDPGAKTLSREQGARLDLVGTCKWWLYVRPRGLRVWRVGQVLPQQDVHRFESS